MNVPQQSIDQVVSMFPHISPEAVRYDLERNGANVQQTVERCLRDGGLPDPPAGFFDSEPRAAAPADATARRGAATTGTRATTAAGFATPARAGTAAAGGGSSLTRPTEGSPSLIERLGLKDQAGQGTPTSTTSTTSGWQATPEARERALKERKAKMVLQARQRLIEKEQEKQQQHENEQS